MSDLVPSVSIEAVVGRRDEIARLVREANALMVRAHEVAKTMDEVLGPGAGSEAHFSLHLEYRHGEARYWGEKHEHAVEMTQEVDRRIWGRLVEKAGIWSLMDAQARQEWSVQLNDGRFPAVSVESIHATIAGLSDQRAAIFERGVVGLFRSLSWDYKSNSPRMLGPRIVLTGATSWWTDARRRKRGQPGAVDRLEDLLRILAVIEGHPQPSHLSGCLAQLRAQDWPDVPEAIVGVLGLPTPLPLFEVRGFKNGNAHVRLCHGRHLDELNRIIAKHHRNVLPPAET